MLPPPPINPKNIPINTDAKYPAMSIDAAIDSAKVHLINSRHSYFGYTSVILCLPR